MHEGSEAAISKTKLRALAEFRHQLRLFLHFSERAAAGVDLQPQQHQLLLQVAGAPEGTLTTVGYVADRLGLRHHSVVELSKRCEGAGLLTRRHDDPDGRRVVLELTVKGSRMLAALSRDHARELNELAPLLLRTLGALKAGEAGAEEKEEGSDEV